MTFSSVQLDLAEQIVAAGLSSSVRLATAESCTGGLISACLTEIPGSSAVVDRGFVVYSNQAKCDLLGVTEALLDRYGAVSAEVSAAMAEGARARADVDIAVAVTGIAGPGGATAAKPVGLVHLTLAADGRIDAVREIFPGSRAEVRSATLERALRMILVALAG